MRLPSFESFFAGVMFRKDEAVFCPKGGICEVVMVGMKLKCDELTPRRR